MNEYTQIEPVEVFIAHRYDVIMLVAVAKNDVAGKYIVEPPESGGRQMAVSKELVSMTFHDAIEKNINELQRRLMIERTLLERVRGIDGGIIDVDYREIAPAADLVL